MVRREYSHGHNRRKPDAMTATERQRKLMADPEKRARYYAMRIARHRTRGVKPPPTEEDLIAAFWARTDRSGECWVWTGQTIGKPGFAYGIVTRQQQRTLAHRMAYELTHGPIPEGLFVCHHCDNPPCIRPDHLFLGTHADNMRDMAAKGRAGGFARRGA